MAPWRERKIEKLGTAALAREKISRDMTHSVPPRVLRFRRFRNRRELSLPRNACENAFLEVQRTRIRLRSAHGRGWDAQCDARDTPRPELALSRPPVHDPVRREAEIRDMSSSAKHADARDVRLWMHSETADAPERARGVGRANAPNASARTFASSFPPRAGAVTESATRAPGDVSDSDGSDSDDDDDDDERTCGEAVAVAGSSLLDFAARRFDLLVGVAGLISALWLWLSLDTTQRTNGDDHAWRWALFVACVFLGRWVARSLLNLAIFALDRYDAYAARARAKPGTADAPRGSGSGSGTGTGTGTGTAPAGKTAGDDADARRPMSALLYYVNVLRSDIKTALLAVGVAVAWSTLMRPSRGVVGVDAHDNISRVSVCVVVAVVFRGIRNYLTHWLASRLHSSTLWEQLHATVRQENILKRLAGPPIRPRPRSRARAKARWKLVKKRADESGGGARGPTNGHSEKPTNAEKGRRVAETGTPPKPEPAAPRTSARATNGAGANPPAKQPSFFLMPSPPTPAPAASQAGASATDTAAAAAAATENASAWSRSAIESLEEASAVDGAAVAAEGVSPADVLLSKTEEARAALVEAPPDAPLSASAAAAAVGASEEPLSPSRLPLRVIDAAARHVLRGTFALPFRVLTSSARSATRRSGSGGHGHEGKPRGFAPGASLSSRLQGELKATTKRAFVSSPEDADAAATLMFQHLRRSGQPFVTPEAVGDFIEPDRVDEAFQLIGGADSGVAALAESNIAAAMRGVYERREACSKTLANTAGLVRNVGRLLSGVLGIVALFISLGVFRVDVANLWLVFSSALLAFAFVFGQTAATAFRALIMIFVVNPFGVGDWVRFGDSPETLKIQELGLNFVIVETFWGEVIFIPVSTCLDARIYNLSRSPSLWMNATFDLDVGTVTAFEVERLREALAAHVDSDAVNYTKGSVEVVCAGLRDPLKVRVSIFYQLAFKASEFSRKLAANSRFMLALQAAAMEMGLSYCGTDGQIFTCEETSETSRARRESREQKTREKWGGGSAPSRRVSRGDAAKADVRSAGSRAASERAPSSEPTSAFFSATSERRASDADDGGGGGGQSGGGGDAPPPPPQVGKDETLVPRARSAFDARDGSIVPGLGLVIPETNPGLRYRGTHRIPGRVRHYTGNLRDMSEVVRFDAREGQSDDE